MENKSTIPDTNGETGGGMSWEIDIDTYTRVILLKYVK